MFRISVFFCINALLAACAIAAPNIIDTAPNKCQHGLDKPPSGDFAIYVFCDDGLGSQIGVILDRKGVGPAEANGKWSTNNRFWQDDYAMTDITQYVWSKTGNFLYVTTSEVYGDNSLYELDLINRETKKLFDGNLEKVSVQIDKVDQDNIFVNKKAFPIKE